MPAHHVSNATCLRLSCHSCNEASVRSAETLPALSGSSHKRLGNVSHVIHRPAIQSANLTCTAVRRCCRNSRLSAANAASGPRTLRPNLRKPSALSTSTRQGLAATAVAWWVRASAAAVAAWRALWLLAAAMACRGSYEADSIQQQITGSAECTDAGRACTSRKVAKHCMVSCQAGSIQQHSLVCCECCSSSEG
jgi:hypothetical protein